MSAVRGLWTPWAEVLCLDCHGPTKAGGTSFPQEVWDQRFEAFAPDTDEGVTRCDLCAREIVVRADVAALRELGRVVEQAFKGDSSLKKVSMYQTGGMCAALAVERSAGGIILFADASDSIGAAFSAWLWPSDEAYENGDEGKASGKDPFRQPESAIEWLRGAL